MQIISFYDEKNEYIFHPSMDVEQEGENTIFSELIADCNRNKQNEKHKKYRFEDTQ